MAAVDPQAFLAIHAVPGAAPPVGISPDVLAQITAGEIDQGLHFAWSKRAQPSKRMHTCSKRHFTLVHIAESGEDALVQQRVAHFILRMRGGPGAQRLAPFLYSEVCAENI